MKINKNTFGYDVDFVAEEDSSALDLSTATSVKFRMYKQGQADKINAECTVDVAASGTCHYTLLEGDTDTSGIYNWELQITFPGKFITSKGTEQILIDND